MGHFKKKAVCAAVFLAIAAVCLLPALDMRLKTQWYTIPSDKITGNIRIALIADLHSCRYGSDQRTLIEAIDQQAPDILLFGGDICDDDIPHDNTEALLRGIADRYPCYYVTGNHEYWSGDIDTIQRLFRSYGVTILNGASETVEVRGQHINICGITDPDVVNYTDSTAGVKEQLESLQYVHENGNLTVLLAHRPELAEEYADYHFDLVLSGHAHGGQWRLPGILNGVFAPDQGIFPKYAGGKYIIDDMTLIVSRGLARETTIVPRIFNRPELVIVDVTGTA
jgi:predicted MPP superfamily phosphohydrolase